METGASIWVKPSTTTNYTVTGTDNNTCTNLAEAEITIPSPYPDEEICLVSVDEETAKNMFHSDTRGNRLIKATYESLDLI